MALIRDLERLIGIEKRKRKSKSKAKGRKRTGPRKKNGEFRKRKTR